MIDMFMGRIQSYNRCEGTFDRSVEVHGNSIGDEFVVTKGVGWLSFLCTIITEWKKFEEKLQALPLTNQNARKFSRFFLAGASACEVDRQGRILLPSVCGICRTREGGCPGRRRKPDRDLEQGDLGGEECL